MKTLVRLIVASVFLVGAASSSLVAYLVGYSQGLNVHAQSIEPGSELQVDEAPIHDHSQVHASFHELPGAGDDAAKNSHFSHH